MTKTRGVFGGYVIGWRLAIDASSRLSLHCDTGSTRTQHWIVRRQSLDFEAMSSSRNVRTYSRRSSLKNTSKRAPESDEDVDERPVKRLTVGGPTTPKRPDVEVKPGESSRMRLEDADDEGVETDVDDVDDGDDGRGSTPVPTKVRSF